MRLFAVLLLSSSCVVLSGCGSAFDAPAVPALGTASAAVRGQAFGGQQPIASAVVTVYEVGSSGYGTGATAKATTATDANGNFSFASSAYTCTASNSPMYLVVTGGNPGSGTNTSETEIAALGACSTAKTTTLIVNEVTTAATVVALGQFMGTALGSSGTANVIGGTCSGCATGTYNRGLVHAMTYTYPQLVDNARGQAVTTHAASGVTVTLESAKLNSIANVLASCVNSTGGTPTTETTTPCGKLFTGVNATGAATRPSDTLQAALQMQLYPYYNVTTVFGYGSSAPPFTGLGTTPNDWTVAISYTTSSFGLGIAQNTSSVIDIDTYGDIWVPSNKTGAIGLAVFNPSNSTFAGPYGGSGLTYPQYVALDQNSTPVAYVTDLASSKVNGVNTASQATVAAFASGAYTAGGPLALDASNNVLLSGNTASGHSLYTINAARTSLTQAVDSFGDTFTPSGTPNAVAVPLDVPFTNGYVFVGDTTSACNLEFSPGAQQGQGDSYSTGTSTCVVGGIVPAIYNNAYMTASNNTICYYVPFQTQYNQCNASSNLNVPKAFALDGNSRFWVANAGNSSIASIGVNQSTYATSAIGISYLHGSSNGSTMTTPYGLAIDGSGNVWVSNAGCVATSSTRCSATSLTLTEVVGVAAPSITPLSYQEIGSSPLSGNRPSN